MALVSLPGQSIWFPRLPDISLPSSLSTALTIDATGEKIAFLGNFYSPDRTSKTINKIGFPTGAITSAGGSIIRVSLQNISLTAGPPGQPDGTQDQYRDANLNTYTANSWFLTGLVTSDGTDTGSKRTVSHGEKIAVVIEYDSGGRLGADSLIVSSALALNTSTHQGQVSLYTTSWATQSVIPPCLFECSDGTFATLQVAFPFKSRTTTTFNSGSTPDEYGLKFVAPFSGKAEGIWTTLYFPAGSSDVDLVLYESGTEIASVAIDANTAQSTANARITVVMFSTAQSITSGNEYIIAVRPTTANSVQVQQFDVDSAAHWAVHAGPAAMCQTTRTNAGAWSDTTTRRFYGGLLFSEIHDGASSGGGGGPLIGGRLAR